MARTVPEWIGKTDDDPVPPRVRLRQFERDNGCCRGCGRKLRPGDKWKTDHIKALINGGENREKNLQTLGECCEPQKTANDVAEKSDVYESRLRHVGIKRKSKGRPMPGTRASGIRKRMSGLVEPWQ